MVGVAPFPDKGRESKTWLLEQDGPVTYVETLLARCAYFIFAGRGRHRGSCLALGRTVPAGGAIPLYERAPSQNGNRITNDNQALFRKSRY